MGPPRAVRQTAPRLGHTGTRLARPLVFPIALALDDDLVGIVGEAIDGALGQDRVVEQRDPLVDGPVAGDESRRPAVPFEDHFIEIARLAGVEAPQSEVIDEQHVGREDAPEHLVGGMIGARLVQELEEAIGTEEEHVVAGPARRVADGGREKRFSDADGTEEDHIFLARDEAQAEEVADACVIERDRGLPVEAFEGLFLFEARPAEAQGEVVLIAARDLVLEGQLQEVEFSELRLAGVGDAVGKRRQEARELQAFQDGLERGRDLHERGLPFSPSPTEGWGA